MQGKQGVQRWVLGSAALMVVGAFGPWVRALGQSVAGTDGSNDGWFVVAVAVIGGLLFYRARASRGGAAWALLGGVVGVAVTLYDRSNVQHAIDTGGSFTQALVQVGWGLNLGLAASASMTIAAVVCLLQNRAPAQHLSAPASAPPSVPAPQEPGSPAPMSLPPSVASTPPSD